MLILKLAARNLMRHPRKTMLLASIIAVGMGLLFVANALFEGTTRGLKTAYRTSLTGDLVIAAPTDEAMSIFGSEVPIVNEYEVVPPLEDYDSVTETLSADPEVAAFTPIVSAAANMQIRNFSTPVAVIGVDAETFSLVNSDIELTQRSLNRLKTSGVVLNGMLSKQAEKSYGKAIPYGTPVNLSTFSRGSFLIRRGSYSGAATYPAPSEAVNRIVLAAPSVARALNGYALGFSRADMEADETSEGAATGASLDDLFLEYSDIEAASEEELTLEDVEKTFRDTALRNTLVQTDAGAWSFVLVRLKDDADAESVRKRLQGRFDTEGIAAKAIDWRTAAGTSATVILAVRTAFLVGIGFLGIAAVLVVMNTLVISVLERIREVGTMRAVGAARGTIRRLFILETSMLTLGASTIGILVGLAICRILTESGILLENDILISLFGGTRLLPSVSAGLVWWHLGLGAAISATAWIYPVSLALKIRPVSAMAE